MEKILWTSGRDGLGKVRELGLLTLCSLLVACGGGSSAAAGSSKAAGTASPAAEAMAALGLSCEGIIAAQHDGFCLRIDGGQPLVLVNGTVGSGTRAGTFDASYSDWWFAGTQPMHTSTLMFSVTETGAAQCGLALSLPVSGDAKPMLWGDVHCTRSEQGGGYAGTFDGVLKDANTGREYIVSEGYYRLSPWGQEDLIRGHVDGSLQLQSGTELVLSHYWPDGALVIGEDHMFRTADAHWVLVIDPLLEVGATENPLDCGGPDALLYYFEWDGEQSSYGYHNRYALRQCDMTVSRQLGRLRGQFEGTLSDLRAQKNVPYRGTFDVALPSTPLLFPGTTPEQYGQPLMY